MRISCQTYCLSVALTLLTRSSVASACLCDHMPTLDEAIESSAVIFEGTAERIDASSREPGTEFVAEEDGVTASSRWLRTVLRVNRVWKGDPASEVWVESRVEQSCDYRFRSRQDYLVFIGSGRYLSVCSLTRPIGEAQELLRALSQRDRELASTRRQYVTQTESDAYRSRGLRAPDFHVGAMSGTAGVVLNEGGEPRSPALHDAPEVLARRLKDDDANSKIAAALTLADIGAVRYEKQIAELLTDERREVQDGAAWALARLRPRPEYMAAIARLLDHSSLKARGDAALVLGKLRATRYAPTIANFLQGTDADLKIAAVEALGHMGLREYAGVIAEQLTEARTTASMDFKSHWMLHVAMRGLAQLNVPDTAPAIAPLLSHELPEIRCQAAKTLGQLKAADYEADLTRLLADHADIEGIGMVGDCAKRALAEMGSSDFFAWLGTLWDKRR